MKKRNGQHRRNVATLIARNSSQENALDQRVISHTPDVLGTPSIAFPPSSTKEVEGIAKVRQVESANLGKLGRIYVNVIQQLQAIGPILALIAILLTY